MTPLTFFMDTYERKARLYPALILIAPVVTTGAAVLRVKMSVLESLAAVVVAYGGAFLLSQLARDAGKKREEGLFKKWGGVPSVAIFRHRDRTLDAITKARYHARLAALVEGTKAPTIAEERADATAADRVYTAWSNYVRVNTRDVQKYSLLFKENINYGFRRNVWGLRPLGITACTVCCLIAIARFHHLYKAPGVVNERIAGALFLALGFLVLWVFRFAAEWVRIPAYAYAERLAEAVDSL
jgi:hypothetical protein